MEFIPGADMLFSCIEIELEIKICGELRHTWDLCMDLDISACHIHKITLSLNLIKVNM